MAARRPRAPWWMIPVALCACKKDDTVLLPFNAPDDRVEVHVGPDAVEDDPACAPGVACADLHSLIEGAVIGSITVEPGSGPVGTAHHLLVVVGDEWEDRIDRVTVEVDGRRGEGEFGLERDRANPGAWGVELESLGRPEEVRVDTWTVLLWERVAEDEASTTTEEGS